MPKSKSYSIKRDIDKKEIAQITIEQPDGVTYSDITWDSSTGLVTAKIKKGNGPVEGPFPIPYKGKGIVQIPPEPFVLENFYDINYNFWYN